MMMKMNDSLMSFLSLKTSIYHQSRNLVVHLNLLKELLPWLNPEPMPQNKLQKEGFALSLKKDQRNF